MLEKGKVFLLTISIYFSFCGCSLSAINREASSKNPLYSPEILQATGEANIYEERANKKDELVETWIASAREIAKRADFFEAGEVSKFLEYEIIGIDFNLEFSQFSKGLLLLYDGYRKMKEIENPEMASNEIELKSHQFVQKILIRIGSREYKKILDKEVKLLKADFKLALREINGKNLAYMVNYPVEYNFDLDRIFGRTISEEEKEFRNLIFTFHKSFAFIQKYSKVPSRDKIDFVETIYGIEE